MEWFQSIHRAAETPLGRYLVLLSPLAVLLPFVLLFRRLGHRWRWESLCKASLDMVFAILCLLAWLVPDALGDYLSYFFWMLPLEVLGIFVVAVAMSWVIDEMGVRSRRDQMWSVVSVLGVMVLISTSLNWAYAAMAVLLAMNQFGGPLAAVRGPGPETYPIEPWRLRVLVVLYLTIALTILPIPKLGWVGDEDRLDLLALAGGFLYFTLMSLYEFTSRPDRSLSCEKTLADGQRRR